MEAGILCFDDLAFFFVCSAAKYIYYVEDNMLIRTSFVFVNHSLPKIDV